MSFFQMAAMAVQAVGQIYQGQAEGAQADAAAKIASANARNARLQANAREEQQRRHSALAMGDIRARSVQTGFDANSGSLASLQTRSAAEMELDALTTRYEGELQAISFQNEAAGLKSQAKVARRSGYLNAFGSLMSGGASYMRASGFGANGPGWSGSQAPAPVESAYGWDAIHRTNRRIGG